MRVVLCIHFLTYINCVHWHGDLFLPFTFQAYLMYIYTNKCDFLLYMIALSMKINSGLNSNTILRIAFFRTYIEAINASSSPVNIILPIQQYFEVKIIFGINNLKNHPHPASDWPFVSFANIIHYSQTS